MRRFQKEFKARSLMNRERLRVGIESKSGIDQAFIPSVSSRAQELAHRENNLRWIERVIHGPKTRCFPCRATKLHFFTNRGGIEK
jgi:hypothetical protein